LRSGTGRGLRGWFGGWFASVGLWKLRKLQRRSSVTTSSGRTCLLLLSDTSQQTFSEKSCLLRGRAWQVRARTILTDIGDVYLAGIVLGDDIAGGLLAAIRRHCGYYEVFGRV